jgi:hypothetical protein
MGFCHRRSEPAIAADFARCAACRLDPSGKNFEPGLLECTDVVPVHFSQRVPPFHDVVDAGQLAFYFFPILDRFVCDNGTGGNRILYEVLLLIVFNC